MTKSLNRFLSKGAPFVLGLISVSPVFADQIIVIQPVIAGAAGIATPDIQRDLLFASTIYAQASITIDFLPTEADTSLSTNLVQNDSGILPYISSSTYDSAPEITVFYVASINNSAANRGTSTCLGNSCAVWVANSAVNDTLAHEVGHILTGFQALWDQNPSDPSHSTDPTNLLASGNIRNIPASISDITAANSPFDRIQPVQTAAILATTYAEMESPEPQSVLLAASGVVVILLIFRCKNTSTKM